MKKTLAAILFCTAISILPVSSQADEVAAKLQIEAIAMELVPSLPGGKKVVLKTISPEDSGLPADFLRKLTSDFEAALLVASEFEIDLLNRQNTEEIWAEAIEFNNAEFDALHAASGASIALMLAARATEGGIEIALTAYSLDTADAGKVLASSGSVLLALDMQQNVGVDVNSLNDQMAQVLAEIEKVGQTGGLISDPNTYAEYYHNARVLQQRGELDIAMQTYESAVSALPLPLVDPIDDLIDLATARYGQNAVLYLEKKLLPIIKNEDLRQYLDWRINPSLDAITVLQIERQTVFAPVLAFWLMQHRKTLEERVRTTDSAGETDYKALYLLLEGARLALHQAETGGLQKYYIDKFRIRNVIDSGELRNLVAELNRVEYSLFSTKYEYGTGGKYVDYFKESEVQYAWGLPGVFDIESFKFSPVSEEIFGKVGLDIVKEEIVSIDEVNLSAAFIPVETSGLRDDGYIIGPCGLSFDARSNIGRDSPPIPSINSEFSVGALLASEESFVSSDTDDGAGYIELLTQSEGLSVFAGQIEAFTHRVAMNPAYDRLIFADTCIDATLASQEVASYPPFEDDFPKFGSLVARLPFFSSVATMFNTPVDRVSRSANITGISNMLITDVVDRSEPIIVEFGLRYQDYRGQADGTSWAMAIDITKDGTFIPDGQPFPFNSYLNWEYGSVGYEFLENGWLYIPAVVQGSVGIAEPSVVRVTYTNRFGNIVEAQNSYLSSGALGGVGYHSTSFGQYMNANIRYDPSEIDWVERLCGDARYQFHCTNGAVMDVISDYSVVREYFFHQNRSGDLNVIKRQVQFPVPEWCGAASSETERAICSSEVLSSLDIKINAAYKRIRGDEEAVNMVRQMLERRNQCFDNINCLEAVLKETLQMIEVY